MQHHQPRSHSEEHSSVTLPSRSDRQPHYKVSECVSGRDSPASLTEGRQGRRRTPMGSCRRVARSRSRSRSPLFGRRRRRRSVGGDQPRRNRSVSRSREKWVRSESPDYGAYRRVDGSQQSTKALEPPSGSLEERLASRPAYRVNSESLANVVRDHVRQNYRMDQQEVRRADAALKKLDPTSTERARLMTEYLSSQDSRIRPSTVRN